jgi:hypothetical protein
MLAVRLNHHQRLSRTLSAEYGRVPLSSTSPCKPAISPSTSIEHVANRKECSQPPSFNTGATDCSVSTIMAMMERNRRNRDVIVHEVPPTMCPNPNSQNLKTKRTGLTHAISHDIRELRGKLPTFKSSKSHSAGSLEKESEIAKRGGRRNSNSGDGLEVHHKRFAELDPRAKDRIAGNKLKGPIDAKERPVSAELGRFLYHALGNPAPCSTFCADTDSMKANSTSLKKAKKEARKMKGIP